MLKIMLFFPILVLSISINVFAGTIIDFETIPGVGVPSEGLEINNQFEPSDGVVFSLEGGGSPLIAEVGAPQTAFQGPGGTADTPAGGQGVGNFFLTDDGNVNTNSATPLIISYNPPTAAASGEILDIDGPETFTVEARDAGDSVISMITINAGDPGTGDGIATPWSFDLGSADISSIRISGTRPDCCLGLAFDNFNVRSSGDEPPPPSGPIVIIPTMGQWGMIIATILVGFFAVVALRRRKES